jgi:hypothetical protein
MNEPRLLVDGRFLGAVMVELDGELGAERAHAVFYQIGFFHGLRDAHRMITQSIRHQQGMGEQPGAEATPLAISLGPRRTQEAFPPY